MKNLLIIFNAVIILFFVSSCFKSAQDSAPADEVADTIDLTVDSVQIADTLLADSVSADTLPPRQYFATAQAALRFMANDSTWAHCYEGSILPQMARDHFPYAQRLLNSRYDRFIVVDKYSMRVMLFDRCGRLMRAHKMACGRNYGTKHEKADERTPEGFFSVEGIYDSTDWLFVDDNGVKSEIKGQFGPRFIRLRIPGTTQIGIHGTCSPRSLGWRCSHGCIRITNEQILQLVELVEPGMPVIVNPGRRDTQVNLEEGYDIPWISVAPDTARYRRPKFTPKPPKDTIVVDSVLRNVVVVDSVAKINVKVDTIKPPMNLTIE